MPGTVSRAHFEKKLGGRYLGRLKLSGGGTQFVGHQVGRGAQYRHAGPLDPGQARATGRYVVEQRGTPYRRNPPRNAETGQIEGPYRQTTGYGAYGTQDFRIEWIGDRLPAEGLLGIIPAIEAELGRLQQEMKEMAQSISPVDTGSYAAGLTFDITQTLGTTGPRGGRGEPPSLVIVGRVVYLGPGAQERDPRAYSMFVEFGGDRTPPYAVLRRTLDWAVPRMVALIRRVVASYGRGGVAAPGVI